MRIVEYTSTEPLQARKFVHLEQEIERKNNDNKFRSYKLKFKNYYFTIQLLDSYLCLRFQRKCRPN